MIPLGRGADAARPIGDIAEATGQSRRTVEKRLEELAQSLPIVANHNGVYLAASPQEAREYAVSLKGRISAVQSRVTFLERWADQQDSGQTSWLDAA